MSISMSILFLAGTISIGWLKGNLRLLIELDWEPWKYWLYFSLPQTYLGLYGWWGLVKYNNGDVWKSMIMSSSIAFIVQISLNSYFWGANYKAILGLFFVILGGLIAR